MALIRASAVGVYVTRRRPFLTVDLIDLTRSKHVLPAPGRHGPGVVAFVGIASHIVSWVRPPVQNCSSF